MNEDVVMLSRFSDFFDKSPKASTLAEFVTRMRSTALKQKTETYRQLLHQGKTGEAAALKKTFPGVTMAGQFEGSRANCHLKLLSHRMMLDWDHTNERTSQVFQLLLSLPYVECAWTSVSGQGVKATILAQVQNQQEYALAYEVVADALDALIQHPVDRACKNVGRYCSEVYDPHFYYNSKALYFDWGEEGKQRMAARTPSATASIAQPLPPSAPAQGPGRGMLAGFLQQFLQANPFVEGTRHETALKLGRMARSKNLSPEEVEELSTLLARQCAAPDFSATEIESCLRTGYQYLSQKPPLRPAPFHGSKVQGPSIDPNLRADALEEMEEEAEKNNLLRAALPCFPQEVYHGLPSLLKRGLQAARNNRESDMLLMGMMAHLSAALPDVRFVYADRELSSHLFFAGVSGAGTGKGVVTLAAELSKGVNDYYLQQGQAELKAYHERLTAWEDRDSEARRKHQKRSSDPKPEEPRLIFFQIPANCSKSRLYAHLRDNQSLGGIIHTSEIDALASAIGQDYGRQDDVLRSAFQHETIASSFKIDGTPIVIEKPRLALCLTGTPNQLVVLVPTQENGLFSRFALLTAESKMVWRSAAPRHGGLDLALLFKELGSEVLQSHRLMQGRVTHVSFTPEQWALHTRFFERRMRDVAVEGDESRSAVVVRYGITACRLASIFTALRKCEDEVYAMGERVCTDQDFRTALLMTEVLLEHSLLLASSLPEVGLKALPLRQHRRLHPVLDALSDSFSYTEFTNKAISQGLSLSTAKRLLKKAEELEVVAREEKLYKKKCDSSKPQEEP